MAFCGRGAIRGGLVGIWGYDLILIEQLIFGRLKVAILIEYFDRIHLKEVIGAAMMEFVIF